MVSNPLDANGYTREREGLMDESKLSKLDSWLKATLKRKRWTTRKPFHLYQRFLANHHCIVAHFDLELKQMEARTAFFNGVLFENVYTTQRVSFEMSGKEDMVCKLKKSFYGLKQASRQWYRKFDEVVTINSFKENIVDLIIIFGHKLHT